MQNKVIVLSVIGVVLVAGLASYATWQLGFLDRKNIELKDYGVAKDFNLTNIEGERVLFSAHDGKVRLVTWIYTHCTQGCSTIGLKVINMIEKLNEDGYGDMVEAFIIDFDFLFDNSSTLTEWAHKMAGETLPLNIEFLLGTEREINQTARDWNFYYKYVNMTEMTETTETNSTSMEGHMEHSIVWVHPFIVTFVDTNGTIQHYESGLTWDYNDAVDVVKYMVDN